MDVIASSIVPQGLTIQDDDGTLRGLRPLSVSAPKPASERQSGGGGAEGDSGYSAVTELVQSLRPMPSHLLPQPAALLEDFLLQVS